MFMIVVETVRGWQIIQREKLADIQGDSGGRFNILEGDCICHCGKTVNMNMCRIVNGCRERAV